MVKVPLYVQPDDIFEVVLDFRLFTVICPVDADGGDKISLIAPAPNVLHDQHSVSYATVLNPQTGEALKSKGLVRSIENDTNDHSNISENGSSSGLLSFSPFPQSADQSLRSQTPSTASANAVAAFPAALLSGRSSNADSKVEGEGVGRKQSESFSAEWLAQTSRLVRTAHDIHSCSDPSVTLLKCSNSAVSAFSQQYQHKVSARGTDRDSNDVDQESGRDPLDERREGTVCRLCTFFNEHIKHSSSSSSYTTHAIFCRLCKEDLRGDTPTPVAVPIPLATPSLTVISSLR